MDIVLDNLTAIINNRFQINMIYWFTITLMIHSFLPSTLKSNCLYIVTKEYLQ